MPVPQPAPQQRPQTPATAPRGGPAGVPAGGAQSQTPTPPPPPGGGALTQSLFSGDHVLESVAKGVGTLRAGARGPAVRALQQFLVAQGFKVGRAGPDGDWGDATTKAMIGWQATHGMTADGVLGKDTLMAMDKSPAVVPAANPAAQQPAPTTSAPRMTPPAGGPTTQAQAQGGNRPQQGAPGSRNGGLPADFQKMWDAHPHNYQDDGSTNTASSDVLTQQGWTPDAYSNTCAIRMSVMVNTLGGNLTITREKAKAAGIDPGRIPYSKKTGWYYILSAKEMWTFLTCHAGKPSVELPARGRFASAEAFETAMDGELGTAISGKKGIVAFDKIFSYSGSGHVDLFDGKQLSDANEWYPSQAIRLWYV